MDLFEAFLITVVLLTLTFREAVAWLLKPSKEKINQAKVLKVTTTQTETDLHGQGRVAHALEEIFVATSHGACFHHRGCHHLKKRNVTSYRPCATCFG